jgi:hypothetical protein
MKPFVVEFTLRTVVMAEDESDAYSVAEDEFREIASDARPDVDVEREVHSAKDLPTGWDLRCIPYGGDGNTRLDAILEVLNKEPA